MTCHWATWTAWTTTPWTWAGRVKLEGKWPMRSVMGVSRNHLIPYPLRHLLISTCVPRSPSPLLQIAHHIHHVSAASIRTCFREDAIPGRVYPRRISNAIRPERGPSPGTCPHYYALFSYTLELSFGGSALLSPFPYHAAVGWIFDGKAVNWIESKWTNWLSLLPGRSHPSIQLTFYRRSCNPLGLFGTYLRLLCKHTLHSLVVSLSALSSPASSRLILGCDNARNKI